jgi:hypothetical protein
VIVVAGALCGSSIPKELGAACRQLAALAGSELLGIAKEAGLTPMAQAAAIVELSQGFSLGCQLGTHHTGAATYDQIKQKPSSQEGQALESKAMKLVEQLRNYKGEGKCRQLLSEKLLGCK